MKINEVKIYEEIENFKEELFNILNQKTPKYSLIWKPCKAVVKKEPIQKDSDIVVYTKKIHWNEFWAYCSELKECVYKGEYTTIRLGNVRRDGNFEELIVLKVGDAYFTKNNNFLSGIKRGYQTPKEYALGMIKNHINKCNLINVIL